MDLMEYVLTMVVVASAHGLSAIVHAVIVIPSSAIVVVAKSVLPYVVTEIGVVAVIVAA